MFSKILITTDGSEKAEKAAPYAIELAKAFDATLQAIYVVDTDAVSYPLGAEQTDRIRMGRFEEMTDVHKRAAAAIDRIREYTNEAGMEIEPVIEVGNPVDVIVRFAEDENVDVIVAASQGRVGVKRVLMGSVTERVTRSTTIPVLVVDTNAPEPEDAVSEGELAR